jgi:ADP-heptose:LPS heptosyltransferase
MTRILLRRRHALGDTLLSTAVAHRLRVENPDAIIDVETICPTAYEGPTWKNPHVNSVIHQTSGDYDRVCDLDMAHERNRNCHQVDAYMEAAFGDHQGPKEIIFPIGEPPLLGVAWDRTITFHTNTSWRNRTIPAELWQQLAGKLVAAGYSIVLLGTSIDQTVHGRGIIDTRNMLNLHQQAAVIAASRAFVCGGSGLFMLSGATETPVVVFLTISKAEHCLPYRRGELGWNFTPLIPDVGCYGCNADERNYGSTSVGCLRSDFACLSKFSAESAFEATLEAIRSDKRN